MRIGYVTTYDPHDRRQWSGLGFHVAHALEAQGHDLTYIGPLRKIHPWMIARKKLFYRAQGLGFLSDRDAVVARGYAAQVRDALAASPKLDVLLSPGTIPVAYLDTQSYPVVVWTDSAFARMLDFYPDFSRLSPETIRDAHALEQAALDRAALCLYSSDWAADTAHDCYGVPREKLHVVPFGANFLNPPVESPEQAAALIDARRKTPTCRLLFLGVDWRRKGGDIAVKVAETLNARGVPTQLVVVGERPHLPQPYPTWLDYRGFVNHNAPSREAALAAVLADAHFLILPTRADCSPVTFSEANAFGVPCLTSNVGGIPSIIRTDSNGLTVPHGADEVEAYCAFITRYWKEDAYRDLALSAWNEYATRLNWSSVGQQVTALLHDLVASRVPVTPHIDIDPDHLNGSATEIATPLLGVPLDPALQSQP